MDWTLVHIYLNIKSGVEEDSLRLILVSLKVLCANFRVTADFGDLYENLKELRSSPYGRLHVFRNPKIYIIQRKFTDHSEILRAI